MATVYQDGGQSVISITTLPKAISCSDEELVDVEIEALRQGAEQARMDGQSHLTTMAAIMKTAAVACDRSLDTQYVALDERKFREIFMLAWSAGYRSETQVH